MSKYCCDGPDDVNGGARFGGEAAERGHALAIARHEHALRDHHDVDRRLERDQVLEQRLERLQRGAGARAGVQQHRAGVGFERIAARLEVGPVMPAHSRETAF